ncbi:hypothetical protein TSAR_016847 [Trichomalopsis sarcophagae]|uniref:Uncharacterized protein n=1 Tax=Trichomalopsis sarcophagae TaxID=543379 RepID=A0A232EHI3_9HYME|nr:hypothetical protein TSAR_016847 [Trichomalopsis sarcophagae]
MITVDSVRARGVNIVDFINEAVRRRKRLPSRSFDQFVRVLPFSGSASDEDDDDDKEEEGYDGEKALDPNNLTFLKYCKGDKKRKRGGSSRAAVDTPVDTSIRTVAPPAKKSSTKRTQAWPYKMAAP